MTATLTASVRECFERFITTEYTTIDSRQQPITWPVTPYYSPGAGCIDLTTGLGYPKKADDAAANPKVALLFSDPTGSGIEGADQVLVQGTAEVDERDLEANRERYWRESWEKLPATRDAHPPRVMRGLFGWYYTRIYVKVRPERVLVWPGGDPTAEPGIYDAHLEEVRAGHSEEPPQTHEPQAGGAVVWDKRMDELGARYRTAAISWAGPDGFPLSVRLPVSVDRVARRITLGAEPAGLPLAEGRACLTAHSHDDAFRWQENFQVRGDLVRDPSGWSLAPHRMVGGFELPNESEAARYRRNLSKVIRFYRIARARRRGRRAAA
jgi:hypothetical protein